MEDRVEKLEGRTGMIEVSLARIVEHLAHIAADVLDLKQEAKQLRDSLHSAKIWALLIAAAILSVLARGFHWI